MFWSVSCPWAMQLADESSGSRVQTDVSRLPDEMQDKKLRQLQETLSSDPANADAAAQLDRLLTDLVGQAIRLLDDRSVESSSVLMEMQSYLQAKKLLSSVRAIDPELPGLEDALLRVQRLEEADELLVAGNEALESQRILQPENDNALDYFKRAYERDPANHSIQSGLEKVQGILVRWAHESAQELDFEMAEEWLQQASGVRDDQTLVEATREEVSSFLTERAGDTEQQAIDAMDSGNFAMAEFHIIDLIALGGQGELVKSLRERLEEARFYGGFEPGQIISDVFLRSDHRAPDIVVISAGSFLMGSDHESDDAHNQEKPRHRVTITRGFGLGVREVTVSEFRLFANRSGYQTAAQEEGSSSVWDEAAGRLTPRDGIYWEHDFKGDEAAPRMPVLHVNWDDAQAYVQWLARETGKRYRLPSEAEYEYVARAGATGDYWWGDNTPRQVVENLAGDRDVSLGNRQWGASFKRYADGHWGPAPTGVLLANPMGVHDITANVSEWVEDCWHQNYVKAPVDGSAWVNPGCQRRVARGGYWASAPDRTRAAFRISAKPETFGVVVGIRIARDL